MYKLSRGEDVILYSKNEGFYSLLHRDNNAWMWHLQKGQGDQGDLSHRANHEHPETSRRKRKCEKNGIISKNYSWTLNAIYNHTPWLQEHHSHQKNQSLPVIRDTINRESTLYQHICKVKLACVFTDQICMYTRIHKNVRLKENLTLGPAMPASPLAPSRPEKPCKRKQKTLLCYLTIGSLTAAIALLNCKSLCIKASANE